MSSDMKLVLPVNFNLSLMLVPCSRARNLSNNVNVLHKEMRGTSCDIFYCKVWIRDTVLCLWELGMYGIFDILPIFVIRIFLHLAKVCGSRIAHSVHP